MQINFKRTFESCTVKRPVPRSWDSEEQMVCYLCLVQGVLRSCWKHLQQHWRKISNLLVWYSIDDHFWNQCSAHCSVCALAVPSAVHYTVQRENAFQHHPQALRDTSSSFQNHTNTFRGCVYWSCCTENAGDDQSGDPHSSPAALLIHKGQGTCGTLTEQGKSHSDKLIYIRKLTEALWNIQSLRKRNSSFLQDSVW